MKTIGEYIDSRISDLRDLQDALQLAMQLEFATIPPYLCAQWSIKNDPDRVEAVMHRIVNQEMYHLALTGNLLTAIGGVPQLANGHFVPSYPMYLLPGGIPQRVPVDLKALSTEQIEVFMQIEHPAFQPVAFLLQKSPGTIGEFYDAIIGGIETVNPTIVLDAFSVPVPNVLAISTIQDAIEIVQRIKVEGEGLPDSPDQPSGDRTVHAHYYLFKELYVQRRLVYAGGKWSFTGSSIRLPDVYQFEHVGDRSTTSREFSQLLSKLLMDLESCWSNGVPPNVAVMFQLQILGQNLIRRGIRPEFLWDPAEVSG